MDHCKNELTVLLNTAKVCLERGDMLSYYFQCEKISRLCQYMVTTQQKERTIRSMAILIEISRKINILNATSAPVTTLDNALNLVDTI